MSRHILAAAEIRERFYATTIPEPNSGCLIWLGGMDHRYGRFRPCASEREFVMSAHRAAWEIEHGPIPDGLDVLHRCDMRLCVNVRHLFLGTAGDNLRDMAAKNRGRHRADLPSGVVKLKRDGYAARVWAGGKTRGIGRFPTIEEAAAAVIAFKQETYGGVR